MISRHAADGTRTMNETLPPNKQFAAANADPDEFVSLPGWLYHDEEFFAHEAERVFRPSWQVVCHVNDIPKPGDYHTFDFLNEAIIVIRGDDGVVRAFHNVCRHRASRLVDGPSGHCNVRLTCRYHAWSYDLRGKLAGIPFRDTFVGLDPAEHGLKPVAARDLSRLHLRAPRRQRAVGRRDDGAVRARDRRLPHGRAGAARPRHAASARGELEEHRRQLFRLAAHQCRASRADAAVRPRLRHRGARMGRQDVGLSARAALGQPLRAHVSAISAEGARICRRTGSGCGSISSSGPMSPSTSIPTRSTSCSSCR